MTSVEEILDGDYIYANYLVEFHSSHKKCDIAIDKLEYYFQNIPRRSSSYLYIFSCKKKGNLFACFENIEGVNSYRDFEKKIINVLNSKVRLQVKNYDLKVSNPYQFDNFHHWLYHCIHNNGNGYFTPYVDRHTKEDEPDIKDIICNRGYIERFEYTEKYLDIGDIIAEKDRLIEIQKKTKEHKKQICKELFIRRLKKHFRFTSDNNDYLSKKVVCDLLDLDHKSKKNIRDLNDILIGYGVVYNDQKMINKLKGVFLNISLK